MGKQVNFYMLADDLLEFEQSLHSKETVLFVKDRLSCPQIQTVDTLAIPEMGKTSLLLYLVRKKDVSSLVIKSIAQKYWEIDLLCSPAVELMRAYHNEHIARRGRLYYHPGFYDSDDNWVDKPQDFIKWADSLLRWIRRKFHRDPQIRFYVGPSVSKWVSQKKGILELN